MKNKNQIFFEKSHPSHWNQVADELYYSLVFLYKNRNSSLVHFTDKFENVDIWYPTISKAYMLLAGYSLENLIKSLLIVEYPELIDDNKLNKKLLKHDLNELFIMSKKIRTSKEEKELLSILSEATPYWGRYPIPRHSSQIKDEVYLTEDLHQCFHKLYNRTKQNLYKLTKNGYIGKNGQLIGGWKIKEYK